MAQKILVIDDEAQIRDLLNAQLSREGFEVQTSSNGREGLNIIEHDPNFSCVITDVKMPEMNGIEFLRQSHAISPSIPVIVITGHATVLEAVEALKLGASALLEKPFDSKKIHDTIREILNLKGKENRKQLAVPYLEKKWSVEIPSEDKVIQPVIDILLKGMKELELMSRPYETLVHEALQEAFDNALEHGSKKNSSKIIFVNATGNSKHMLVSIQDEGEGFNPIDYINTDRMEANAWHNAPGLFKIYNVAKQVVFNAKGNQILIIFERH